MRTPVVVDTDHPLYESGSEEFYQVVALRYSHSFDGVDFGLSYFRGTSREPYLMPSLNKNGEPVFLPYYEQINHTAFDMQGVFGSWLVKGEALYRTGYGRSFAATTLGFEYTVVRFFESAVDLKIIGEYVFDDRQEDRASLFNNDLMTGVRLAFNDAASSDILFGLVQDLDHSSRLLTMEAGRRINDFCRVNVEAAFFMDGTRDTIDSALVDDEFIKIEVVYFF